MADRDFQGFMKMVARKVYPESAAKAYEPLSPPRWQKLGWMVGWIIEEGYTGLQWWVTNEENWEQLTAHLGSDNQQRTQVFINWYVKRLKQLGRRFGVPVRLESVRWRRIDFQALLDRPRLKEEKWWQVDIGTDDKCWNVIFPDRFFSLFGKEQETEVEVKLPWQFTELWEQISGHCRQKLMQKIGTERGLLNHIAGLIAAGALEKKEISSDLPKNPQSELKKLLGERQEILRNKKKKSCEQTQKSWKKDSDKILARQVGKWLVEGGLSGEGWDGCARDWNQYRLQLLQEKFSTARWKNMWQSLSEADLKQIIPRLDLKTLTVASAGTEAYFRAPISEVLPDKQKKQYRRASEGSHPPDDIFKARAKVYEQGREFLEKSDIEIAGEWEI